MPFIPVPNCTEVVLNAEALTTVANVFHVYNPSPTMIDMQAIADVFDNWLNTGDGANKNLIDLTSEQTLYTTLVLTDITTPIGFQLVHALDDQGAGTSARMPPADALVISWETGIRGRSYRGRTYVHSLMEDQNDTLGTPSLTLCGNLTATAINLMDRLTAAGYPLVIASKYEGTDGDGKPIPRVAGLTTNVTGAHVDAKWDTQRRRRN